MNNKYWGVKKRNFKSSKILKNDDSEDEEEEKKQILLKFPILSSKSNSTSYIYSNINHIYFNNDITTESSFELIKELKNVETQIKTLAITLGIEKMPIYLHLTTDGGLIYSAMAIIDCIKSLSVDVYTVVSGFVASAGTLISLAGKKRYMCENAYMLIHELRSGMWGKMTEIDEEYSNLKKLMKHIIKIYVENTKLTKKELENILKKDFIWDMKECMEKGLIHDKFI